MRLLTADACEALAAPTRTAISTPPSADAEPNTPASHLLLLTLAHATNVCSMHLTFARGQSPFSFTVEGKSAGVWRTIFAEPESTHDGSLQFAFGSAPLVLNLTHISLRFGVGPAEAPRVARLRLTGVSVPVSVRAPDGSASLDEMRRVIEPIFAPATFPLRYNGAPTRFAFSALSAAQAASPASNIRVDEERGAVALLRSPSRWAADNSPRFFVAHDAAKQRRGDRGTRDGPREVVYRALQLLGGSLSFTVDVSQVGCSCIAALYLVAMPAVDADGKRVLGPESYCDAVGWNGYPCPELDLFEGNRFAMTSTVHPCQAFDDAPERWQSNLRDNPRYPGRAFHGELHNEIEPQDPSRTWSAADNRLRRACQLPAAATCFFSL